MDKESTYYFISKYFKFFFVLILVSFVSIQLTSFISSTLISQDFEIILAETTTESEQNETNEEIQEDEIFSDETFNYSSAINTPNLAVKTEPIYKSPYSHLYTPPPEV